MTKPKKPMLYKRTEQAHDNPESVVCVHGYGYEGENCPYCAGEIQEVPSPVNHPSHYNHGKIEVIEFIADQGMAQDFCLGNAIKYLSRAKHKGKYKEDLEKARWYVDYLLAHHEK
jgi:hypothetical protein